MSTTLVAQIDSALSKTPWQNLDVLTSYLVDHPDLLELKPNELAEQLQIPPNHAAVLLASPEVYERLVAATLQRTIKPQKHGEILQAIAEEALNPEQPLGPRIAAAKFVSQQTGVLRATKMETKEEKLFRVILQHGAATEEVQDVFDPTTRLIDPSLPPDSSQAVPRGGEEVVDADFTPADG